MGDEVVGGGVVQPLEGGGGLDMCGERPHTWGLGAEGVKFGRQVRISHVGMYVPTQTPH